MGCGGSRLNPEHNAVPARLRPILWRRFEEIRARCNGGNAINDISKKDLICEGGGIKRPLIPNETSFDPIPNFHQTQDCPPIPQQIANDDPSTCSKLSPNQPSDGEEVKKLLNKEDTHLHRDETRSFERGKKEETVTINDDMVGLGSPSFRVYCKDTIDRISNLVDDKEFDEYIYDENVIDCQRISTSDESVSSNEVSVKHLTKKGRRGKKFKKMIPKGRKYMFNMQSLYNFPCSPSSSHGNSHLLQRAAA